MIRDPSPAPLPPDTIEISGLRLTTRIGVPDDERRTPQSVKAFLSMEPAPGSLAGLDDTIERTIDYYAVSRSVRELAASGERRLIETLAEEIVDLLLAKFPVRSATVEVRKFILADTDHVAVRVSKSGSREVAP